jgi:hypothetical protein
MYSLNHEIETNDIYKDMTSAANRDRIGFSHCAMGCQFCDAKNQLLVGKVTDGAEAHISSRGLAGSGSPKNRFAI